MGNQLETLLQGCDNDLSKNIILLHYKFASQLCVYADPLSLLSVEISGAGKIENVADVVIPRKDQFQIFLRDQDQLAVVISAIRKEHPEFQLDIVPATVYEGQTEDENSLVYTMPPVSKERRDLLLKAVDLLYGKAKAIFEKLKATYSTRISKVLADRPQDADAGQKKLDELFEKKSAQLLQKKEDKIAEIEEAYEDYQKEHDDAKPNTRQKSAPDAQNEKSVTQSMQFDDSWKNI